MNRLLVILNKVCEITGKWPSLFMEVDKDMRRRVFWVALLVDDQHVFEFHKSVGHYFCLETPRQMPPVVLHLLTQILSFLLTVLFRAVILANRQIHSFGEIP